ncbi:MAG: GGDEF domain-containing protein [Gammaproteobacteria bacterium]|jgi:diguanylate cyclase (GGDEF)-like protein
MPDDLNLDASGTRAQVRGVVLRFYHSVEWIVIAVFVAGALVLEPSLRESPAFLAGCALWICAILALGRAHWPVRNDCHRFIASTAATLLGALGVLWLVHPGLNGLFALFPIVTTTAWIVLPGAQAIAVAGFAVTSAAVVLVAPEPGLWNLLFAGALGASCLVTAWLTGLAMRAAALAEARAAAAGGRDELTGVPGRQAFLREAQRFHSLAEENKLPYAIVIVDINNLSSINDTFGYGAGDRAILVVAQALERLCAAEERIARYEGDKFVVLLPQLDGNRADELAKRIRSVVFATTIGVDSEVVRIKANVGIAKYPLAGVTTSALLSAAERDMKLDQRGRTPPGRKPVFRRRTG